MKPIKELKIAPEQNNPPINGEVHRNRTNRTLVSVSKTLKNKNTQHRKNKAIFVFQQKQRETNKRRGGKHSAKARVILKLLRCCSHCVGTRKAKKKIKIYTHPKLSTTNSRKDRNKNPRTGGGGSQSRSIINLEHLLAKLLQTQKEEKHR